MQVTITNASTSNQYIASCNADLNPTGSTYRTAITTRRSWADLDQDYQLKALVQAGTVTLAFVKETGDAGGLVQSSSVKSYTNVLRPAANTVPLFSSVWNSDDNCLNFSDGTNWRDGDGVIT